MKKKNSKAAKIWIIVGCIAGGAAVVGGVIMTAMLLSGDFPDIYCPQNTHKMCSPLGGDEESCYCAEDGGIYVDKPIIYLYPEAETEVEVKLGAPEKLAVSYPQYMGGWKVLAEPSGKLTDLKTGRELYSLYWEGKDGNYEMTDEGFVVKRADAIEFLEEKLALLGLNEREAEEFIVYWLPKMQENEYNYVRFASAEEIEKYMPLEVTPQPETVIRVLMVLRKLDGPIEVAEQKLEAMPARSGFTVVEWGGSQ